MDEQKDQLSSSKAENVTKILDARPQWKHLFAFTTKKHLHCLLGAGLSSASVAALRIALAITLGCVFEIVAALGSGKKSGSDALSDVSRYCIILTALGAAQWLVNSMFLALWVTFGELQAASVRQTLFQGLVRMEKSWIDSLPDGTSGIVASIQRKVHELQIATSQVFGYLAADILAAIASLAVAFYTSWKLAFVLLASVPPSIVVLALSGRKIEPAAESQAAHLNSASKKLAGSLGGIDLVKIYNGYSSETQTYMTSIGRAAKQYRLQAKYNSIQIGYTNFWAVGLFAAGFWYGLALVQKGEPPGKVLTTFYSVMSALQGIESLLPNWIVFEKGMGAGQVLQALRVEVAVSSTNDSDLLRPGYFVGAVDFKDVDFSYPTTPMIPSIERCTLSISAGDITFLVGHSGSGKSTIANLMTRTYDTLKDSIYVDGIPIKRFDPDWIRQRIVLVEQAPIIFKDTLFRNIVLGHPDPGSVSFSQVHEACRRFGLESTIATLTGGLYAMIGGKGCPLSGGQRQRVALARAYLKDPAILILDEPSSALDNNSREAIMNEIREWRRGKTTIIICHDFERIDCDEFVYVLDKGSVSEYGFKRDIEAKSLEKHLSLATSMSINEKDLEQGPWIEINVIPPPDEANEEESCYQQNSQTWLRSRSNSSTYSDASFFSPRFSVVSQGAPNSGHYGLGNRRLSLFSNALPPPTAASHLSQLQNVHRISSFINRRFEPIGARTSLQFSESMASQPYAAHGAPFTTSNIEKSKRNKPSRRRLVELGVIQKKRKNVKSLSYMQILQTVIPALSPLAIVRYVTGILLTIAGALTTPAFSICLAKLLAVMWSFGNKSSEGRKWALYLILIAVVDGLCSGTGRYLVESSAQSWVDSVRRAALNAALRQPKTWFMDEKRPNAKIVEAFDMHSEEMRNNVGRFLPIFISVTTMVSVSFVWALITCWRLTLVALAPLPLMAVVLKAYSYLGDKWETTCATEAEQTGSIINEVLTALRTIRNYGLESHFGSKYTQAAKKCRQSGLKKAWYPCPLFGFYQSFSYGLTALLFYYGTFLIASEQTLSVASVLQVLNLLLFSIGSSTELLSAIPQLTMAISSASRMLAYTELKGGEVRPELETEGGRASPLPVRMRNVAFAPALDQDNMILKNLSLDIMPGICKAIVGPSGSGKSTVLSLILGLHRPLIPPSLTYADTPCSMMDLRQLRATIGYVPQTAFLFPATIAENIAYGLDETSPLRHLSNIRVAARDAGIDEYIMSLPEGYNTLVGEGGQTLSGGQTQRITVARALAREPALLVMDEPTSALDAESAEVVRDCVSDLVARWKAERRQAAVVMVTHNVEMMRVADTIIVLEGGQNVEQGAYEDLLFSGDAFRRLVQGNDEKL